MNLRKRIAATTASFALVFGASLVGAPAHATSPIGVGVVEIFGATVPGCQTNCQIAVGTGVVVDNPWSTNEVLTVAHVVDAIATGNTIYIYDPYTQTVEAGYVQRKDDANDLAVLWIYDPRGVWPTAAPTFATAPIANANPDTGTLVFKQGSSNDPYDNKPQTFATANGSVTNNADPVIHCGGRTLYNEVQTTYILHPGDSGGPLWDSTSNIYDPNRGTVEALNDCTDLVAPYDHSYAIQIGWAYYDMLNTRP